MPSEERIPLRNEEGRTIWVAPERAGTYEALGYRPETASEEFGAAVQQERQAEYDTTLGAVEAFGEGGLRALTGGLSDAALVAMGRDAEDIAGRAEFNSTASGLGEVTGMAVGLASLGSGSVAKAASFTPAGAIAKAGAGAAGRVAGRLGGVAGQVAGGAAAGGIEGALYGGGMAVSDAAIKNKALTAEALLASVGKGALYGAALGGAVSSIAPAAAAAGRAAKKGIQKAASVAGRVDDAAREAARKAADKVGGILRPGAKEVAEAEMQALKNAGAKARAAVQDVADTAKKATDRAKAASKLEELDDAYKKLDDIGDAASVENYHQKLKDISADPSIPTKFELPESPIAKTADAADDAVDVGLGDLLGDADPLEKQGARQQVAQVAKDMERSADPLLAEAREIAASQKSIDQLAGGSIDDIMEQASGGAELESMIKRVESSRKEFQNLFQGGSDDALETLFSSSQAEFSKGIKAIEKYDRSVRELAERLDDVAPSAVGPSRVDQFSASPFKRAAGKEVSAAGYDLGDMLALADIAGIDIKDVPLVGQIPGLDTVLKARLAYRKGRGIVEKLSMTGQAGRVASVAIRAKAVEQQVQKLARSFVRKTSSTGNALKRAAVPAAATVLRTTSFGTATPAKKESEEKAFKRISDELNDIALNPDHLRERVIQRLDLGDEELAAPAAEGMVRRALHLHAHLPQDPQPDETLIKYDWHPPRSELVPFTERVWATGSPLEALALLPSGEMSIAMAESVREVYPELFASVQDAVFEELAKAKDIGRDQKEYLHLLMGAPITAAQSPEFAQAMQADYLAEESEQAPQPKPGLSALNISEGAATAADTRPFR